MWFITNVFEESYKSSGRTMSVLKSWVIVKESSPKNLSVDCRLLERADMKPISREVKQRGWKMIGHRLRQDQSSDCYTVHSNNLGTRRKKKKRKTKNYLQMND